MRIDQRETGGVNTTDTYAVDEWEYNCSFDGSGFGYSFTTRWLSKSDKFDGFG